MCAQKKGREIWRKVGLLGNKNAGLEGEIYFSSRGLVSMLLNCCSLILATIVPLRYSCDWVSKYNCKYKSHVVDRKEERVREDGEGIGGRVRRMKRKYRNGSEEMGDRQVREEVEGAMSVQLAVPVLCCTAGSIQCRKYS